MKISFPRFLPYFNFFFLMNHHIFSLTTQNPTFFSKIWIGVTDVLIKIRYFYIIILGENCIEWFFNSNNGFYISELRGGGKYFLLKT